MSLVIQSVRPNHFSKKSHIPAMILIMVMMQDNLGFPPRLVLP